jgi:beta-lactamase class A
MRLGRRGFLASLAAGAILGCRASTPPGPSSERPAAVRRLANPAPAATSAPLASVASPAAAELPAASAASPAATRLPAAGAAALDASAAVDGGRGLERAVDARLRQRRGSFGVAVRELAGPVAVEVEARDRFELASLYKVLLMYEVARQVGEGRLRLDDQVRTAPEYSFGEPEGGVPPDTKLTVDDAVAAAIEISSNGAALALIELVTPTAVRAAPGRLGLGDTTVDAQPTGQPGHYRVEAFGSARDLAELFARLGRGQLVSPALDSRMVGYLLGQQINDRLPLLLPAGTPVGHKTGDVDSFTHDGGLVLLPGRAYAIVVLAEAESLAEGRAAIAEVSRLVHDHFSRASG